MAQKRYWNFKADDATKDLNRWLNGIVPPGRYFGYDLVPSSDLTLVLNHSSSGFSDVDDEENEVSQQAKIVTRQGTVIVEDAAVTIGSVSAGDGSNPRIDVVVLTHEYTEIAGGSQATYSIIEGTPASSPVAPSLTNSNTQTKIGELLIPTGATQLDDAGVTWTPEPSPTFTGSIVSYTANRAIQSNASGQLETSGVSTTELGRLTGLTANAQGQFNNLNTGKQDTITGAATTITASNLIADRALISNSSGKVAVSSVTSTELNYLDGVTSNIQTQLNAKQGSITGGATTIVSANLTASRALMSNASGKVTVSAITSTELLYLDGVTSNIQSQLNAKQGSITGGASTIVSANLSTNRALISDGSGKVAVSVVTSTELGYLDGVTSNIQTQFTNIQTQFTGVQTSLDAKQDTITGGATTVVSANLTASRVLQSDNSGKIIASNVTGTELVRLSGVTSNVQLQLDTISQRVEIGGNTGSNTRLFVKAVEIGEWNMDATSQVDVNVGVDADKIVSVEVSIFQDGGTIRFPIYYLDGGYYRLFSNTNNVQLLRAFGEVFDSVNFDQTGGFNRGYVTIVYEE